MYLASQKQAVFMYYFVFCLLYLLSLLPFWLLYLLSDVLCFLLYHVFNYRKAVVFSNLEHAFPEKTVQERKWIAKKFYKNLTDQMVETIKMMSISKRQLQKRFIIDPRLFNQLEKNNTAYQIHLGHFFNWEWANLYIRLLTNQPFLVIYKPLRSRLMNRMFKYIRSRFGSRMIASSNLIKEMKPYKNSSYASVLVADQHPANPRRAYWFPFLNRMTSFFKGPELSAKRGNLAVVFGNIIKVKRGYYKIETELAFAHARDTEDAEITKAFVVFLENCIRRQPENWLWSHRRWKRIWKGQTNQ